MKYLIILLLLTGCFTPTKKTSIAECAKACRLSPMSSYQDENLTCGCVNDKTRSK